MGRLLMAVVLSVLAGACIYDAQSPSGGIRSGDGGAGGIGGEGGSGAGGATGGAGGTGGAFAPGSRGTCETCTSDSDCAGDDQRCVQMHYRQLPFPDGATGFCLRIAGGSPPAYDCAPPYVTVLIDAPSLSSSELHNYCSIREDLTTCLAMRAHQELRSCAVGGDTACPIGGVCGQVRVADSEDVCTYPCDDDPECQGSSDPRCADQLCE